MTDEDAAEPVATDAQRTRRDRRVERDRHRRSFPLGWVLYSVAVLVIMAGAMSLAVSAGR
jgi:hypothetical protein